jgi:hypothetical protein
LWADRRAALTWAAAFSATAAVLLLPPLLSTDWQAIAGPYRIQLTREPMGPTFYGSILPETLEGNDALGRGFRFGALALLMIVLCLTRPPDLASVLRRGAVAVIVFAGLAVFYSPQWILWFSPLLVPLAGRSWSVLFLVVALDAATYLTFPVAIDRSYADWAWAEAYRVTLDTASGALVYIRFVLCAALVAVLGWAELRRTFAKSAVAGA